MSIDFESKLQQYLYSLISTSNTNLANTFDSFQLTLQQTISEAINRAIQEGLPLLADSVRKEYASLPTDPTLLAMASEISSMLKTAIAERDEALAAASAAKEQLAALTSSPQTTSVVPALKSAVFEIQKHATQAEILTSLVEQSANFAPRIVLFVVKSGNAVAWLAKGFDSNTIGDEAIRGKMLALNSDTILRKALSKQTTYYEPPLGHKDNKQIFELLSSPLPAVIAAIPLVVRGKAAAVLYADAPSENLDVDSLDILVDVAALTIELLSFRPKGSDVQLGHKPSPPGHTSQKTQGTLEENAIKSNQALAKSSEISSTESVVTAPAPSFPPASPTITTEPQKGFDFAASPAPTPPSFSFTPPPATEPPQKGFDFAASPAPTPPSFSFTPPPATEPPQKGFDFAASPAPTPPSFSFTPPPATEPPQKGFDFAASPAPTPPSFSFTPPPATEPPQKGFDFAASPAPTPPSFSFTPPPATEPPQKGFDFAASPAPTPPSFSFTPPPATEPPQKGFDFAASPAPTPPSFSFTPPPSATADPRKGISGPTQQSSLAFSDENERKLHEEARRFARLLVSEIKLYNEKKVEEGRKNKDLYDRLKEDIDRSRQAYEKRVNPIVAAKFDYFYDELLNILGESDPSKLGSDCPGPVIIPLEKQK